VGALARRRRVVSVVTARGARSPRGIATLPGTTDHKRIAGLIAVTAAVFFVGGGLLALFMRTELAAPGMQLMDEDTYNQMFSIHGSAMIYLFMTPIALAAGVYLVPLQVGAAELSGARWALAAYWAYALGGLMMFSGFLTDHGAGRAGWFAYTPLSTERYTPGTGMDLWTFSVALATAASIVWAACILGTIARRRAPGMTMLRLAPFTWSEVATVLMVLFSFPSVVVAVTLLALDRSGIHIYGGGEEGAILWQHLFWFYGHPVVYVMFFPFVGMVLEVVAAFARKPVFGYKGLVLSLLLFAALSMSVWSHHMFVTGHVANRYFSLTSTALILPAGLEYFAIVGTMVGGAILLRTPMLFAVGFVLQFLIGGLTGIFVGSPPLDYAVHDTYFVVAHLHYVLFAGSFFGLFAGIYFWWPKVTGWMLRDGLGKVQFAVLVLGTNLTFFPMHFLGVGGMARRVADYPPLPGWETLNLLETIGAYLIALGILIFLLNVWVSRRTRVPVGPDPWGSGQSLEWATTSPPPRHNFDWLPPVRSYHPVWDLTLEREGRA
jgi:cytochrome c oxidase subunit 1